VRKRAADGDRMNTAGPGRNAEALAGAGNPMPPQSGRRQDSEEHRTFKRGSAGQGDLRGAETGSLDPPKGYAREAGLRAAGHVEVGGRPPMQAPPRSKEDVVACEPWVPLPGAAGLGVF
jgi:hypothetical protein